MKQKNTCYIPMLYLSFSQDAGGVNVKFHGSLVIDWHSPKPYLSEKPLN